MNNNSDGLLEALEDDGTLSGEVEEKSFTIEVTVENLAPENGIGLASLWFGLHDGSFDYFDEGEVASDSLEFLAEEGLTGLEEIVLPGTLEAAIGAGLDPSALPETVQQAIALELDLSALPPPLGTLSGDFMSSDAGTNGGTQGLITSSIRTNPEFFDLLDDPSAFPQERLDEIINPFFLNQISGETESFQVTLNGTPEDNRYFSFAAMLFPTNDGFIGNDNPQEIAIFDVEGNFIGADFIVTNENAFDGGTEVNDELSENLFLTFEAFGQGAEENGTIQQFPGFLEPGEGGILDFEFNGNLVASNADFTGDNSEIARISVSLVEEVEESDNVELFRFRNITSDSGAYIFVDATERDTILANSELNQIFALEGGQEDESIVPAFTASSSPGEGLVPFFRLSSLVNPGSFLFVGTGEYDAIFAEGSDQQNQWEVQGLDAEGNDIPDFYLSDGSLGSGVNFNRFQNTQNNTFFFAGPEETEEITNNPELSNIFTNQGFAFASLG